MLTQAPPFWWGLNLDILHFSMFTLVLIVDKCVFSRFLLYFIHRFFRLNPIARKNHSVRIFRFPVEKKRRKPKSCFIRPNAPST